MSQQSTRESLNGKAPIKVYLLRCQISGDRVLHEMPVDVIIVTVLL